MNSTIFSKKSVKYILIGIIWLVIWEVASLIVHNSILLVGPFEVLLTLVKKCTEPDFYVSVITSFLKIGLGFILGTFTGIILAVLSWRNKLTEDFLKPMMSLIKASPVASFVVLFLIWWHSNVLSVAICICVVMPQLYVSTLQGLKSADEELLQMAGVFKLHPIDIYHYIYRPALYKFWEGAVKIAAGMAWKSGIAAEVIGTPDNSIGSSLYMSKIYLDTAGVLSYTAVIILLSVLCEHLLLILLKKYSEYDFKCHGSLNNTRTKKTIKSLKLENLAKSFNGNKVLKGYSAEFKEGFPITFDWPSGEGKTTLFKILAGVYEKDAGMILPEGYMISFLFQEDRLVEGITAIKNVELVCGSVQTAHDVLIQILDEEDIYKPVEALSGGQKRRVAIARACAAASEVALFDEPYEGLDAETKNAVRKLIYEYGSDKILLIASHIEV